MMGSSNHRAEGREMESQSELLSQRFLEIEEAFARNDLDGINIKLENFDLNDGAIVCTGVLRITARAKKYLPAWEGFKQRILLSAANRGEDIDQLLYGL
jgi:hypothetical protein